MAAPRRLGPDRGLVRSLLASAGGGGWLIDEPGEYTLQATLQVAGRNVISPPLQLRVKRPRNTREEQVAADFFSDDVARVLTFGGSRSPYLQAGIDLLQDISEDQELRNSRIAFHARLASYRPLATAFKKVIVPQSVSSVEELFQARETEVLAPKRSEAIDAIERSLMSDLAPRLLGYVHFAQQSRWFTRWLQQLDQAELAQKIEDNLKAMLSARPGILNALEEDFSPTE
jgi:hypothetical protein